MMSGSFSGVDAALEPDPGWITRRVQSSRIAFLVGGITLSLSAAYLTYAYILYPWEGPFLPSLNWGVAVFCFLEWRMRWGLIGLARWAWETRGPPTG